MQATKTFEYCAREAAQIFGGASYVRGGKGEKVERLYREVCSKARSLRASGLCLVSVRALLGAGLSLALHLSRKARKMG